MDSTIPVNKMYIKQFPLRILSPLQWVCLRMCMCHEQRQSVTSPFDQHCTRRSIVLHRSPESVEDWGSMLRKSLDTNSGEGRDSDNNEDFLNRDFLNQGIQTELSGQFIFFCNLELSFKHKLLKLICSSLVQFVNLVLLAHTMSFFYIPSLYRSYCTNKSFNN